jgi:uncharacterized protein (TIGR02996 family)
MADIMAIVSKAVFEKAAGKDARLGKKLGMDRYVSANKGLQGLADGGRLFLVTVRPPDEALWLVAVLDQPKFSTKDKAWIAAKCETPSTDISALRSQIKFVSGTGITAAKGALGMSLQTPRALTADDVALLDAAVGSASAAPPAIEVDDAIPLPGADGDRKGMLLANVLTDPDSDGPRQVYADFLMTANDPRGEYIHLEMALDGPLSIRKRDQLKPRYLELKKAHGKTWWPWKGKLRTHKGFVDAISASWKDLEKIAPEIFAVEPVVEVEVIGADAGVAEKLATAGWMPRVQRLIVRGSIGDEGLGALCRSPATSKLRSLNVTATGVTSEGVGAIADGLGACTSLVLTANEIGDEGAEVLTQWEQLAGVETLYLSQCELSSDGVSSLLSKSALPKLQRLYLSDNSLDDGVGKTIATYAKNLPALRHVELHSSGVGSQTVAAIAKAKLPSLVRIDARRNDIDGDDFSDDERVRVE